MRFKVLLADDVDVDRTALRAAFAPLGFEVSEVDGTPFAGGAGYDCVIVGHRTWMGQQRALVAQLCDTPLIVTSSVADAGLAEQAIAHGAEDFIDDDVLDPRCLARVVRNAVARSGMRRTRAERADREVLAAIDHLAACLAHGINNPATFMTHNLGFLRESVDRLVSMYDDLQLLVTTNSDAVCRRELLGLFERHHIGRLCSEIPLMVEDTAHGMSRIIELVRQLQAFQRLPLAPKASVHVERLAESVLAHADLLQDGSPLARSVPSEGEGRSVAQMDPALTTVDLVCAHEPCGMPDPSDKPLRILAVDDEVLILSSIRRMLREHHVILANGGQQALEAIRENRNFDGILCDLMMPEVDGEAFHHALRHIAPELLPRVAFFTGGTFTKDMQAFVRTLQNPVLDKPLQPQAILSLTQRWTDMNRPEYAPRP